VVLGIEIVVGLFLLYPSIEKISGLISFGLLLLFSIILIYASQTEENKPCGCFGELIETSSDLSLLKNLILLLLSAVVVFGTPGQSQDSG
jgi:triosephosphate isomerase